MKHGQDMKQHSSLLWVFSAPCWLPKKTYLNVIDGDCWSVDVMV
uniref:Uncharacterized protein n=1 Tax=Anguilla anguilla TaxID=7936 RepID=A0A0E9S5C4_ANGAN